jgi:hypothetical protein
MLEPSINLCGSHLYRFQALTGSLHSGQSFPDTPLVGNPTIAFRTTYKVIGNLLGGLSTRDCDPVPPSLFVIDEDMRTRTLNSRLTFESHSVAAGCVANLSAHLDFTSWPNSVF